MVGLLIILVHNWRLRKSILLMDRMIVAIYQIMDTKLGVETQKPNAAGGYNVKPPDAPSGG